MNNITTISEHVLLPHQANWLTKPEIVRLWRSPVETALGGAEDRASVRGAAWMRLSYSVLPYNHVERARFDDRMRAGIKAGNMAVPHWGRGVALLNQATAGHKSLVLVRANHGIVAGKYVLVQSSVPASFDTWDLCLVLTVTGARLNLSAAIANTYLSGTRVWPLLFGRPMPEQFEVLNSARGRYAVVVQFDRRQINAEAYDDFEDYDTGDVITLNGGYGWNGPWVIGDFAA